MSERASAAVIEFIETEDRGDIRRINQCRINGTPVLVSNDHDIHIYGIVDTDEPVMVTLTLFASEIRIGGPK